MDPNPYQSPQTLPPTRRANLPLVVMFSVCVAVWAFFAVLIAVQYYDAAVRSVPPIAVGRLGIVVVLAGFVLSSVYLWRAMRGWPRL